MRLSASCRPLRLLPFQSTRPHRVRPLKILFSIVGYTLFQSTHPHRVRHACKGSILFPYLCFNPRTHTGCDVSLAAPQFLNRRFQSTHPHGVRHVVAVVPNGTILVSIHAPTRGATVPTFRHERGNEVSIHAPTRGATKGHHQKAANHRFQSTHPHGVRLLLICCRNLVHLFQSTHPHGVRRDEFHRALSEKEFQSTHPHGVRLNMLFNIVGYTLFQSTHPHGVRPAPNCEVGTTPKFQSTHPHGVRRSFRFLF